MSYSNPTIPSIASPTGLDTVIESIRTALAGLAWLDKSFGRAWEHKEMDAEGKVRKLPKVYTGEGEYLNVLPNDNLKAQSFIACRGPEEWEQFNRFEGSMKTRKLSVIFWGDLQRIDPTKDYIFIDILKNQVEDIIKVHPSVQSMDAYYDERAEEVFEGYSLDDVANQYITFPFTGFRLDFTVIYPEEC